MKTRIGKTKVDVEARGCCDCGTEHSSGWSLAKTVPIKVGEITGQIEIHRCADCFRKFNQEGVEKP